MKRIAQGIVLSLAATLAAGSVFAQPNDPHYVKQTVTTTEWRVGHAVPPEHFRRAHAVDYRHYKRLHHPARHQQWYQVNPHKYVLVNTHNHRVIKVVYR